MLYEDTVIMKGDNKVDCDICSKKTESKKGNRLRKIPPVLMLSLL